MSLRVLHVLDHSIPLQSGYAFRTRAILREQRRLGWETFHLTSPKHSAPGGPEEEVDGLRFYRTRWQPGAFSRLPIARELTLMRATARRIEQVARLVRPDILHAHSPVLNAIPALWVGRRLGIPVVYEVRAFWEDAAADHGTAPEGGMRYRLTRALETYALRRADAVTTICEGLRSEIVARGIPQHNVTVIPNAVDIDKFTVGREPDEVLKTQLGLAGCVVLGFIGSFYAYEGLALLLDVLPKILAVDNRVRLLLVGGGPQDSNLKHLAASLAIGDKVVFTGRVPHDEVQRYYDLIDVLVYPRLSMRLTELVTPLKPLEAMAQGRLLVASDVGGHRELIKDQKTGILFKAGDAETLATKVLGLLADRPRWPQLRAAARRFVETERNWAASVSRYRQVYPKRTDTMAQPNAMTKPRVVVFTTLFPHPGQPTMGLFIRERMFRVAEHLPVIVVAPVPWFPLQGLIRKWKPHFRPDAPRIEQQAGIEVLHPRFFSVPGGLKWLDGIFMALACLPTMLRVKRAFAFNLIDAHFAYPDGYAATLLGRWLRIPVTITLRGTEVPLSRDTRLSRRMLKAVTDAARVFSVSNSLRRHLGELGADIGKIRVVGNGVDLAKFSPIAKSIARQRLGLPDGAPVLISVGALVERKGIHRVLEVLPRLQSAFPGLRYLVVGGASPEGDWSDRLRRQVIATGLESCVTFLGKLRPEDLSSPLSAADVFILATSNEGWANVFLEAMACGLPVVTTDVGGNREVVSRPELGIVVPFGDGDALYRALISALNKSWDRSVIMAYARDNAWDRRVRILVEEFATLAAKAAPGLASGKRVGPI